MIDEELAACFVDGVHFIQGISLERKTGIYFETTTCLYVYLPRCCCYCSIKYEISNANVLCESLPLDDEISGECVILDP